MLRWRNRRWRSISRSSGSVMRAVVSSVTRHFAHVTAKAGGVSFCSMSILLVRRSGARLEILSPVDRLRELGVAAAPAVAGQRYPEGGAAAGGALDVDRTA